MTTGHGDDPESGERSARELVFEDVLEWSKQYQRGKVDLSGDLPWGVPVDIFARDGLAYLAEAIEVRDDDGGGMVEGSLRIIDVREPMRARVSGRCMVANCPMAVRVADGLAYIVDDIWYNIQDLSREAMGLRVVDVSDPGNPFELGRCPLDMDVTGLAVTRRNVLLAGTAGTGPVPGFERGLLIVSADDPAHPRVVGHVNMDSVPMDVVTWKGLVFVAGDEAGLYAFDLREQSNPKQWRYPMPWPVTALAISGDVLYAAGHQKVEKTVVTEGPDVFGGDETGWSTDTRVHYEMGGFAAIRLIDLPDLRRIGLYRYNAKDVRPIGRMTVGDGILAIDQTDDKLYLFNVSEPSDIKTMGTLRRYGMGPACVHGSSLLMAPPLSLVVTYLDRLASRSAPSTDEGESDAKEEPGPPVGDHELSEPHKCPHCGRWSQRAYCTHCGGYIASEHIL